MRARILSHENRPEGPPSVRHSIRQQDENDKENYNSMNMNGTSHSQNQQTNSLSQLEQRNNAAFMQHQLHKQKQQQQQHQNGFFNQQDNFYNKTHQMNGSHSQSNSLYNSAYQPTNSLQFSLPNSQSSSQNNSVTSSANHTPRHGNNPYSSRNSLSNQSSSQLQSNNINHFDPLAASAVPYHLYTPRNADENMADTPMHRTKIQLKSQVKNNENDESSINAYQSANGNYNQSNSSSNINGIIHGNNTQSTSQSLLNPITKLLSATGLSGTGIGNGRRRGDSSSLYLNDPDDDKYRKNPNKSKFTKIKLLIKNNLKSILLFTSFASLFLLLLISILINLKQSNSLPSIISTSLDKVNSNSKSLFSSNFLSSAKSYLSHDESLEEHDDIIVKHHDPLNQAKLDLLRGEDSKFTIPQGTTIGNDPANKQTPPYLPTTTTTTEQTSDESKSAPYLAASVPAASLLTPSELAALVESGQKAQSAQHAALHAESVEISPVATPVVPSEAVPVPVAAPTQATPIVADHALATPNSANGASIDTLTVATGAAIDALKGTGASIDTLNAASQAVPANQAVPVVPTIPDAALLAVNPAVPAAVPVAGETPSTIDPTSGQGALLGRLKEASKKLSDAASAVKSEIPSATQAIPAAVPVAESTIATPAKKSSIDEVAEPSESDDSQEKPLVATGSKDVPRIVHFAFGLKDDATKVFFRYRHYLAIKSAAQILQPSEIMFHYKHLPASAAWRLAQEFITQLVPTDMTKYEKLNDVTIESFKHQSDLLQLDVLIKHGGIYLDIDVITLKSFEPFMKDECSMSILKAEKMLSNAVIVSRINSKFLRDWKNEYSKSFDQTKTNQHSAFVPMNLAKWRKFKGIKILPKKTFYTPDTKDELYTSDTLDLTNIYAVHLHGSDTQHESDSTLQQVCQLKHSYGRILRTSLLAVDPKACAEFNPDVTIENQLIPSTAEKADKKETPAEE